MNDVTIHSSWAAASPHRFPSSVWTGRVPIDGPDDAFRMFNRVDAEDDARLVGLGYRLPSMSVGDLVTINDVTYLCLSAGFDEADGDLVARVKADPVSAAMGLLGS
jgi:hypothetical protein